MFKALLPDPAAQVMTHRVAVIRSIAAKLESLSETPDIGDVMDAVSELLDRSVGAEEYIIRSGGDAGPLIDLNQIDFEQLALRFAGSKRTAAKQIEQNLEKRLDAAVRKNPTRLDLVERFRQADRRLQRWHPQHRRVPPAAQGDQRRADRGRTTHRPRGPHRGRARHLRPADPARARADQGRASPGEGRRQASARTRHEKLVLDWRKRQHTRAAVQVAVGKVLDEELPEVYGPELFDDKVARVYEHIYASYFDNGDSVYSGAFEETPAVVPTVAMPSAATDVGDVLLDQARNDPAVFARLMEEVFGLHETWTMPTEKLLAKESKQVELKQTARWDVDQQQKNPLMEEIICKTVAGFLNAQGGTLFIGVDDDGRPVGLAADFATRQAGRRRRVRELARHDA